MKLTVRDQTNSLSDACSRVGRDRDPVQKSGLGFVEIGIRRDYRDFALAGRLKSREVGIIRSLLSRTSQLDLDSRSRSRPTLNA